MHISLEKFCSNTILRRIFNDDYLSLKIDDFKIDYWENHSELISSIWKEIVESDLTSKYLNNTNISFENDKSYITNLYRKIIASNKKLYEFFEDNEISWINDLPLVNSLVLSSLKNNNKNSNNIVLMKDIYKNKRYLYKQKIFMFAGIGDNFTTNVRTFHCLAAKSISTKQWLGVRTEFKVVYWSQLNSE